MSLEIQSTKQNQKNSVRLIKLLYTSSHTIKLTKGYKDLYFS